MGYHANYITKEATIFKLQLSAIKSTGKCSCDAWYVDNPVGHQIQKFLSYRTTGNVEILNLFLEDKIFFFSTAVLIPDFILIPMKIIYHFSFVMRNASLS